MSLIAFLDCLATLSGGGASCPVRRESITVKNELSSSSAYVIDGALLQLLCVPAVAALSSQVIERPFPAQIQPDQGGAIEGSD